MSNTRKKKGRVLAEKRTKAMQRKATPISLYTNTGEVTGEGYAYTQVSCVYVHVRGLGGGGGWAHR